MPRMIAALAMIVSAAALVACSGGTKQVSLAEAEMAAKLFSTPANDALALEMTDFKFSNRAIRAKSGEVVEVALMNRGSIEHDFSIATLPGEKAFRVEGKDATLAVGRNEVHAHLKPSANGVLRFRVSAPGAYQFFCTVSGHKEAGMAGTLNVQ